MPQQEAFGEDRWGAKEAISKKTALDNLGGLIIEIQDFFAYLLMKFRIYSCDQSLFLTDFFNL